MRLFAYGGSGLVERKRIGKWSGIYEAALSSKDDLDESDQFGVGVGKEGLHLVYRTWVRDQRDGYAYTLLLAPSVATWTVFQWNAALLLHCFLKRGGRILLEPEDLTEAQLGELEANVRAAYEPLPEKARSEPHPWHLASVGTVLEERTVIASPGNLDFQRLPELDCMIHLVHEVDACFRIGSGWLIGGGRDLANALRTGLVMSGTAQRSQGCSALCARGRQFLEGWKQLPSALRTQYEQLPMHLWTGTRQLAAAFTVIDGLRYGSGFDPPLPAAGAAFDEALQQSAASILRERLQQRWPMGADSTRWLLSWLEGQIDVEPLTAEQAGGLDFDELAGFLLREGILSARRRIVRLSPELAIRVARNFLERLETPAAPDYVACAAFLNEYGVDGLSALTPNLEAAVTQHRTTLGDLYLQSLALPEPEKTTVRSHLEMMLESQMHGGSASWLRDAIHMGLWDEEAAQALVKSRHWEDAVLELNKAERGPKIEQWLASLAGDAVLRPAMSLATKRLLAAERAAWKPFRRVDGMVSGLETRRGFKLPATSERPWLLAELLQMVEQAKRGSRLPSLESLQEYLHLTPAMVAEIDERIRPRLGWWRRRVWRRKLARLEYRNAERKGDRH